MSIQINYLEVSRANFERIIKNTIILEESLGHFVSGDGAEIFLNSVDFDHRSIDAVHYLLTGTTGMSNWLEDASSPDVIGNIPENLVFYGGDVIESTTIEIGYNPLTPVQPDPFGWDFGMPHFLSPHQVRLFSECIRNNDFNYFYNKNNNPPEKLKKEISSVGIDELEETFSQLRSFFDEVQEGNFVIIAMT